METAFLVEIKSWSTVNITEFRYQKRTARMYMDCSLVGHIVGRRYYLANRVRAEEAFDTLDAAISHARLELRNCLDAAKRVVNDWNSRLGEVEKVARVLGIKLPE